MVQDDLVLTLAIETGRHEYNPGILERNRKAMPIVMPSPVLSDPYLSSTQWSVTRPDVLVVACSDGRLQVSLDDFLNNHLGIHHYDRFFIPGGSGGLVPGDYQFVRAGEIRKQLLFLVEAHGTDEVILLAHGAADDGPPEATCAYYRGYMSRASLEEVRMQQVMDVRQFVEGVRYELPRVRFRAFRAEVGEDLSVRYVRMV